MKVCIVDEMVARSNEAIPLHVMLANLRREVQKLTADNAVLANDKRINEINADIYKKNEQHLREQIVLLQAKLLASQDRVLDLQGQLLALRDGQGA